MKKITDFIVKKRNIIVVLFIIFAIISVFLSKKVKINYDMAQYLPSDSKTRIGLDIMNEEFEEESQSSLNVMFKNLTQEEKTQIYKRLSEIENVSSVDYEQDSEEYNKGENTLYILNVDDTEDSTSAAFVYHFVEDNFKDYEFYTSGSISERNMTILPAWILILAVGICALILIIMCESYVEPFLFLLCIGIAVLLNNGTNIIFGTVSNITSSISAILQLALSMDYSIMLMNRYKQEKEEATNKVEAMKEALYKSFGSISSSSVTTIVGLVTLVFMSFTIGRDLGLVLAKGVLLSLLVIFTCLPAFILMFDKLIVKTKKKAPNIKLNKLGEFAYQFRKLGLIVLIILFVGSYILKGNLRMLYTAQEVDKVAEIFPENNQMAIIYNNEDEEKISKYLSTLEDFGKVDKVLAYGNTIGQKLKYNELNQKLEELEVDTQIDDYLLKLLYYKYYNNDVEHKMTFDEFVTFTKNNVLNNEKFSSQIDENTKSNIERLEKFTKEEEMNQKRTYREMAKILDMDEDDSYNLFVYYFSDKVTINLTISEFVNFIQKDVLTNKQYAGSIDASAQEGLNTISKFTNKKTLNKKMNSQEMGALFGIEEKKVNDLYLYYYSIYGTHNKMTLNELANYVVNNYSSMFDVSTMETVKELQTMSNPSVINQKMKAEELANLFGIDQETISQIMLLKYSTSENGTRLSIAELINFITYLKENTNYLDGMDVTSISKLKSLANNTNNINTIPMNKQQLSQVFKEISNGLVDMVYAAMGFSDDEQMTTQQFVNLVIENFSSYIDSTALNQLKIVKVVIDDSLSSQPKRYCAKEISSMISINPSKGYQIYALYDYIKGNNANWKLSPYEFVKFILDNSNNEKIASHMDAPTLEKLQKVFNIMNSANSNSSYYYGEMANFIGMDEGIIKKLYVLSASSHTQLTMTPMTFVDFLLQHKNDEVLRNNIETSTIKSLTLVDEIMDSVISNKGYLASEISNLLGLDQEEVKLLYSLYSATYLDTNRQISLKEFVEFTLNHVVTNEKYANQFDQDKIVKLNTINAIMNAVINKTPYNAEEIFAILSNLTDGLEQKTIDILYLYYGSEKYYQDSWTLTIEELINYIHNDILPDNRFEDFIGEETREQVTDAKTTIQENKEKLIGKKHSRIILNTKFDLESDETYQFLQKIYDELGGIEFYIIGDSPMSYEISQTFESEFNFISILTIIAIFLVVAITFKSIGIPCVLVLIIQCAVYMTMSILSLLGGSIYFIALLIVQSILMGATIDYAILYTSYYKESRATMNRKESVINSYNRSINTIITSSSILIIATFLVGKFATAIVSKICITLFQGVLCSTLLILLVLPEILAVFDRWIVRKK